jgi:hypothetical protein
LFIFGNLVTSKPLVFRAGSCKDLKQTLVYSIEEGKSTVGQVLSDERYEFHKIAYPHERVSFREGSRYLIDEFDLFRFPPDDCVVVDLIPKPISCEVAPTFVEISRAKREVVAALEFDPMEGWEIGYIKNLISRHLGVQFSLELKLNTEVLEDSKLLSDYRNPRGGKIVIAKTVPVPPSQFLPVKGQALLIQPNSELVTPVASATSLRSPVPSELSPPIPRPRSNQWPLQPGASDPPVPSFAAEVTRPPDSGPEPPQHSKHRKRHKIGDIAQSEPVAPPVELAPPALSESLQPTLVPAPGLRMPGSGARKAKVLAEIPELLPPPAPKKGQPESSASLFEFTPSEEAVAPPPGPLPGVSEPTPLGKKTIYTFSHRNHADIFESFEKFETIFDAKVRLGKRYDLAPQDIVLLYQGKSLGDHLVLSRLRLRPGAKVSMFCKEQSDFILRTAIGMRLPANLTQRFRLANLRPKEGQAAEFDLDLGFAAQALDAKTRLSGMFKLRMASQVALWNGLNLVADEATLDEITFENGKVGFTLNSEIVGEYNELKRKEAAEETTPEDDSRMAALLAQLIDQLTNSEKAFLDRWQTEEQVGYPQKVLFLIQSSRDLAALASLERVLSKFMPQ